MIISKKVIPRRTMLRGLGAALALPLLDAMVPALANASETAIGRTRRLGIVYVHNGMRMEHWTPTTTGSDFELPSILQPLQPFHNQLNILTGLPGVDG